MSSPWQERCGAKVTTPEAAARTIQAGRRILIGSGAAEPDVLVDALVRYGHHLADNEIVHLLTLGRAPHVAPGLEQRFRHTAFFIGQNVRNAVQEGRAGFCADVLVEDEPMRRLLQKLEMSVTLEAQGRTCAVTARFEPAPASTS